MVGQNHPAAVKSLFQIAELYKMPKLATLIFLENDVNVSGWFKATQAMAILALIALAVACILGFAYMFFHKVSKQTTLILMTVLQFTAGEFEDTNI